MGGSACNCLRLEESVYEVAYRWLTGKRGGRTIAYSLL